MESQTYDNIISAINSADTQSSKDFDNMLLTGANQGLYKKNPLTSELTQTGTAVVSQNTVAIRDTSRVKDTTDLVEIDWNFKTTTSKPFIVKTGQWLATQSTGDTLSTFSFPRDYFNANHVLNQVGNTFLSFRGDLHFIITTIGSPFAIGSLIASNSYGYFPSFSERDRYFKPHVILDISDNTSSIDFVVPFKWYRNSCSPFDIATTVAVEVLEPLQGLTSANYTITCFLENQEFRFLRPTTETSFSNLRVTQGLLNITNISNTLTDRQEANLPMEMVGDQYDIGLGMDDVGTNNNPEGYLVKFNSLNNSSNPHTIEKVALKTKTLQPSTYDTFNTKMDEMSIKHLFQDREHYYNKFNISTSTTTGSQLFNMAVCPNPGTIIGQTQVNAAEYIMQNTKFWRGGMKIKLRFFMNRFQAAKVYLGLFYKAITPSAFTDWSSSHGVILDIGGDQREVIVEIPYNSETPWLQTCHGNVNILAPTSDTLSYFDYILGQFTVYSLSPLVSPTGSPTTIKCHVSYSMCEDFELAGYSTNTRVTQGMDTTVKLSKPSTRTQDYITDTIESMKDIYRKYQKVSTRHDIKLDTPYVAYICSPDWLFSKATLFGDVTHGNTKFVGPSDTTAINMRYWGSDLYHGYRGGLKFRFDLDVFNVEETQQLVPWQTNYTPYLIYVNPDTIQYQQGTQNFDDILKNIDISLTATFDASEFPVPTPFEVLPVNTVEQVNSRIFEVEIPWQRNLKYIDIEKTDTDVYKHFGLLMLVLKKRHSSGVGLDQADIRMYAKPADDGRFGIAERGAFTLSPYQATWGGSTNY